MKKKLSNILKPVVMLCAIVSLLMTSTMVEAETQKDVTKTFKYTKKVSALVDNLTDYFGYQLLYTDTPYEYQKITLDTNFIFDSVGIGMYDPTAKKLQTLTQNVYGKKPSIKSLHVYSDYGEFENDGAFVGRLANGQVLSLGGDWGCAAPQTKVNKITKLSKNTYKLNTRIYFVDGETNKRSLLGAINYVVKTNSKSKYGFVITGITINRAKKK